MQPMRFSKILIAVLFIANSLYAKKDGLIFSGLDTINYSNECGYDFYLDKPCTTLIYSPAVGCFSHFSFGHLDIMAGYYIAAIDGKAFSCGKMNLDSIKSAQSDSVLARYNQFADTIPNDSLESIIGNVYIT